MSVGERRRWAGFESRPFSSRGFSAWSSERRNRAVSAPSEEPTIRSDPCAARVWRWTGFESRPVSSWPPPMRPLRVDSGPPLHTSWSSRTPHDPWDSRPSMLSEGFESHPQKSTRCRDHNVSQVRGHFCLPSANRPHRLLQSLSLVSPGCGIIGHRGARLRPDIGCCPRGVLPARRRSRSSRRRRRAWCCGVSACFVRSPGRDDARVHAGSWLGEPRFAPGPGCGGGVGHRGPGEAPGGDTGIAARRIHSIRGSAPVVRSPTSTS
jgi:hypothetical protein